PHHGHRRLAASAGRPAGPAEARRGAGGPGRQGLGSDAETLHGRARRHLSERKTVRGPIRAARRGHGEGGAGEPLPPLHGEGGREATGWGGPGDFAPSPPRRAAPTPSSLRADVPMKGREKERRAASSPPLGGDYGLTGGCAASGRSR